MNAALIERQRKWQDPKGKIKISIQGASEAACFTGFLIEPHMIVLDAGLPCRKDFHAVVITHTHPDHCQELPKLCMNRKATFNVFCPAKAVTPLQDLLTASTRCRGCSDKIQWNDTLVNGKLVPIDPAEGMVELHRVHARSITPRKTVPVEEDPEATRAQLVALLAKHGAEPPEALADRVLALEPVMRVKQAPAPKRRKKDGPKRLPAPKLEPGQFHPTVHPRFHGVKIRAFALKHEIDTLGYVFYEPRTPLIPSLAEEIKAAPTPEARKAVEKKIGDLRRAGHQVTQTVDRAFLAVAWDCTTESACDAIKAVMAADNPPVFMVECSFISDAHAAEARSRKHVLWSGLGPTLDLYPDTTFHLVHFSRRYSQEELYKFALTLPRHINAFV